MSTQFAVTPGRPFRDVVLSLEEPLVRVLERRLVLARAYSNDSGQPVNNRSRFRVASVSKPITSTLLHHLQQTYQLGPGNAPIRYTDRIDANEPAHESSYLLTHRS